LATHTPQAGSGLPEERKYKRAIQYVSDAVWAIHPSALATILQIIGERRDGYRPTAEEIRDRIGAQQIDAADEESTSPVAVIEINGPIFPKAGLMTELSGATSIETLRSDFRAALANPDVKAILLNIDSPGGSVDQVPEMAAEILAARGQKPIVAQANGWAASAAYHLASGADEIVVTPSGEVGSIGVYTAHDDISAAQEKLGIKTTLISAGKYKTEGSPLGPLEDEARAEMQSKVDAFYKMFVSAVAKGRGVTAKDVTGGFGEGRMVMAEQAVEFGMADRVATFDQTFVRLEKLGSARGPRRTAEMVERRTIPIEGVEWRTSEASGETKMIVRGHAAVFDRVSLNLGGFKEKFADFAFDEILDQDPDVHFDWEHSGTHTLARTRSSKYQLELRRDPRGLHFYATVAPTSYAKDLRLLMESQVVDQASVVFATPEDGSGEKWEMDAAGDIVRTITKVSGLYGVCVCAQGAYPQTDTALVRNLRSRLAAEIDSGRLPEAAAKLLPDVAPDDPAGRPTSQPMLGEANDQRTVAPDDPAGGDSSHQSVGEERRVAARERQAAIEAAKERKREIDIRKYRLSTRPETREP
jgi:HK97 family phage prohead protease